MCSIHAVLPARAQAPEVEALPQSAVDAFYLAREGDPVWIEKNNLTQDGHDLIDILRLSWMHGLNPKRYHIEHIDTLLDEKSWGGFSQEESLALELTLTDGYIRYSQDLSGMRVNARSLGLRPKDWKQQISEEGALTFLSEHKNEIKAFLLSIEPQGHTYQRLKKELAVLVEQAREVEGLEVEPPLYSKHILRPGRSYEVIPQLRTKLGGVLDDQVEGEIDPYLYDPQLTEMVKGFQHQKGLKADGFVGPQTFHALNHNIYNKINQIVVNMERLRWVHDEKPERFIVVNIPSATLWAVDGGDVVHEMPVVVGRKKRATPSFITTVHGVRLNPTWTIPPTIKEEDIWPKLIENPQYLSDKGIELYEGYEKNAPTLDPTVVEWSALRKADLHGFRMVQVPGGHNPLGYIRVLMPNEYNIYLHDTNDKSLFLRTDRAKSSGCVRLKEPHKIASFILEARRKWNDDRIDDTLKKGEMTDVYTQERMPVYMLYYTVWVGDKNQIVYGMDIYDRDKTLTQAIENLDGFSILGDNDVRIVQFVD
ncbi:MAG: L,D-transpeptidase family protein [Alphaproteobacteria bacterium]